MQVMSGFCIYYKKISHGLTIDDKRVVYEFCMNFRWLICGSNKIDKFWLYPEFILTPNPNRNGVKIKNFLRAHARKPHPPSPMSPAPAPSARGTWRARAREFSSTTDIFFAHASFQNHDCYKRNVLYFERKLFGVFFEHRFLGRATGSCLP